MKWVLAARQLGNFYDRKDCFHWVQNALLRWWVGFRPWRYSPSLLHYVQFTKKELSLNHLCSRKMFQFLNASLNFLGLDTEYSLSKPKKLRTVSYEWELNTAEFWNLFLLQVNVTRHFYLLVSNVHLTLLFFTHEWLQLKLTNQWRPGYTVQYIGRNG